MNLQKLVFALVVVFVVHTTSYAVDTTRYALISSSRAIEAPQLPALKSPATRWWLRPANLPVEVSPGAVLKDENLMGWTPMSIAALGYDIREVWRMEGERVYSYSLAFSR